LLLRPLGLKPDRPPDDPPRRWELTCLGLQRAFQPERGLFDRVIEVPAIGNNRATRLDARRLVPSLTRDVLVHTWDLARAVGADDRLDPAWCQLAYAGLPADPAALGASGMFNDPVTVDGAAGVQSKLLARLGRDPSWRPPVQ
jgi:uncharacterized protein (TIGR03086 family)